MYGLKCKYDKDGYRSKHKSRLCFRGDLQKTEQDIDIATPTICCDKKVAPPTIAVII